ncbi:hypothetical protein DTO166G4_5461 [Paecilomyces variotii]|nr:hypothetical protein DTO166G4_5461 [Paecilomyces variotii]KAJ9223838.1 hypothetical protein DTO169C6_3708 [Paecilomyces variotii]KAJ9236124.1 hypothetical protein DTO166G5_4169 [Paecilomyces variotii]KAJ9254762.1 hypothetical protein DTO195F2_6518 [Paecilomyces variotii]KAJ9286464.1 hypothetical protein DTO021C3_5998 [Paecilomyces variotii]
MTALSVDSVISLLVGIPSLIVAILTYWETRRTRHEQVRSETVEFEAVIARRYLPTQIAHASTSSPFPLAVFNPSTWPAGQHILPADTAPSLPTSALPQQVIAPTTPRSPTSEPPPRPSQDTKHEHTVTYTSQTSSYSARAG